MSRKKTAEPPTEGSVWPHGTSAELRGCAVGIAHGKEEEGDGYLLSPSRLQFPVGQRLLHGVSTPHLWVVPSSS